MNSRKPPRVALAAGLLAAALIACTTMFPFASAAEPTHERIDFERIDIPADLPKLWPKEIKQFVQEPRQKFLSMVEQINSRDRGPKFASLLSAHYEATLVNETLRGGLMTASVKRLGGRAALLDLGRFSFALEELKWQGRPAIWGSAVDGRTWVFTDGINDELLGEWSCRGRTIPGGIDFDLQLPPATTSFLDLRVPRELFVRAANAEVTLMSDIPTERTKVWRVHCGVDSHCRVTFLAQEGIEKSRRSVIVEHEMEVVVRDEDLRFQLNLHLEALDAPIDELTLRVPAGLEIYSAVYGVDTPVPIRHTPESKVDGLLSIQLPGLLKGLRRTLRINGSAEQKPGQPTILPQVVVENSIFDGGLLAVTVQHPLKVRSIRTHGYRQRTTNGEKSAYQQLTPDAQLILDVHREPDSLTGQLLSILAAEEYSWTLVSEIKWKSPTGGGYQANCVFPPEWEVTDVSSNGDAEKSLSLGTASEFPKLNWDVKSEAGGRSILSIEFLESIQPKQPRAVTVVAQRKAPQPGQYVPVPLPQLQNCDVERVSFGLEIPNSMTCNFSSDSQIERDARPDPTRLKIPNERPKYERRWYRCDSPENAGTLQLTPRLQPVHATAETVIEALPAEYRLKYLIHSEQRETQADRLLIYLTESSPDVRWVWKSPQPIELTAIHLSKSQNVEWGLPSKGELWEIRLPRAIGHGVAIEGTAVNRWPVNNRPAMLFIPQAIDKQAELKLTHPDDLELEYEVDGMKSTGKPLSWWYSTPQAEFNLAIRNPEPSREFPLMVSMQLQTLMSADADGSDLYRAVLQLENGSSQDSLRIKLDPIAILKDTFVNGESRRVTPQNGEFVIGGLSAARPDIVELVYRVPARANVLWERRRIVVPQVGSSQVLGFFWKFGIPPSTRIFAEPQGVTLSRHPATPSWNERLFGPLGRSGNEVIFQPFQLDAWRRLYQPAQNSTPYSGTTEEDFVAAIEWQAASPDLPQEIWVELWHAERLQILAWISLGLCLLFGIVLRMCGWIHRDRVAAYTLGLTLAATFSVSLPYTSLFGGATAGILIALLIPRPLLRSSRQNPPLSGNYFQSPPGVILTILLVAIALSATSSSYVVKTFAQETLFEEAPSNKRPIVYVPVDQNGQPSETIRWVYVSREALDQWKTIANEIGTAPNYLISSANYHVSEARDGSLNIVAKYRVHLLTSTDAPVPIELDLAEVNLPDTESCRVNGVPHPISLAPNGKGYSIELISPRQTQDGRIATSADQDHIEDEFTTFEIELRARKARPQSAVFDLRIPAIAISHFEYSFTDIPAFVEVIGGHGATQRSDNSPSVIAELGLTSNVQVHWGQEHSTRKGPKITASMLQHLELHAGYSKLDFHLVATIEEGSLGALEFDLPQNAIVRKVQLRDDKLRQSDDDIRQIDDELLQSDVIISNKGQRRLRLVFEKQHVAPVIVDGTLILTQSNSLAQTPLPKFGLSQSEWFHFHYARNWWGVSSLGDFRLEPVNLDPENVITIPSDVFIEAWRTAAKSGHFESPVTHQPQFTFELREGTIPSFTLTPYQSRRRAKHWKQSGVVGRHRLEWTAEGDVETLQTPTFQTFQTVLIVDRRLRIEEVSVIENDAERRTRFTELRAEPSRVVIFLNDKTQGIQTIRLRGSLPLTPGTPISLPTVRVEDCDMGSTRLELAHDPEVEVAFTPPLEWKQTTGENSTVENSRTRAVKEIGKYQLNDFVAAGTIQTSLRHSRCTSRAAVVLSRADTPAWHLKYRLEMTPEGDSPVRMGLLFPPAFSDLNAVTVERAELDWREPQEGMRQLDLILNRNEPHGIVVLQFEITVDEPKQPDWELPLPTPLYSNGHETFVAIDQSETVWFPKSGREIRVSDLPEGSTELKDSLPGDGVVFSVPGSSIELQRDVVKSDLRAPTIRLLDQRVWIHADGRRSGITQAFLSSLRADLDFLIPVGASVTSVFVDDHPLALSKPFDRILKIPVIDIGAESLLTMTWIGDGGGTEGVATEPFLWPRDIRIEKNLITILPDDPIELMRGTGMTVATTMDQGLDRLETLLARHATLGIGTRGAMANRVMLDQLYLRLKSTIPSVVRHADEQVDGRLKRWKEIVKRLNQLESVVAVPAMSWSARLLDETDTGTAIRGQAINYEPIRVWQFDRRIMQIVRGILLVVVLIPILRRIIRVEWSDWLHRHVAISWLLLATVWWLFLTPSVLGSILLLVALVRAISQYKPTIPIV